MSTFKTRWAEDRLKQKQEREQRQFDRAMSAPVTRAEFLSTKEGELNHIATFALAIESLEELLISKGVLEEHQLMAHMEVVAIRKREQIEAQALAATGGTHGGT